MCIIENLLKHDWEGTHVYNYIYVCFIKGNEIERKIYIPVKKNNPF